MENSPPSDPDQPDWRLNVACLLVPTMAMIAVFGQAASLNARGGGWAVIGTYLQVFNHVVLVAGLIAGVVCLKNPSHKIRTAAQCFLFGWVCLGIPLILTLMGPRLRTGFSTAANSMSPVPTPTARRP